LILQLVHPSLFPISDANSTKIVPHSSRSCPMR
jgi:hypothetical protein